MRNAILAAISTLVFAAFVATQLPPWSVTTAVALPFIWAYAIAIVTPWLPVLIVRRMLHRITDGRPLAEQSVVLGSNADIDGRVLQNTAEQTLLWLLASGLLTLSHATHAGMLLLVHAAMFTLGRACFWWGYSHRSPLRVYGFGLTFFGTLSIYLYATSFLLRALILN